MNLTNEIPAFDLALIGAEYCRLQTVAEKLGDHLQAPALKYSLRKLKAWLDGCGLEMVDLTDETYDPGMAVEVADILGDASNGVDAALRYRIARSLAPLFLKDGRVISPARVILEAIVPPPSPWQTQFSRRRNAKRAAHRRNSRSTQTSQPPKR
jgi:hypothetical protein